MLLKPKTVNDLATPKKEPSGKPPMAPTAGSAASAAGSTQAASQAKAGGQAAAYGANTPQTIPPPKGGDAKPTAESKDAKSPGSPSTQPVMKEAMRALYGGIADAIVDMRCTTTEQQEADLSRSGYVQLLQDGSAGVRRQGVQASSTFGNKASLWIWRRSFGTCSGRFKPVVDAMLDSTSLSSDLVLAGYTCDPTPIAGQYLWTKRATTEEEEKDAIIDLFVTTGKMKNTSDPIWQSPGVGWVRVEGNFSKSMFGSLDTFLWYRPARTRSAEASMVNPLRGAIALPDEIRMPKIIAAVRLALRHYIPVQDVKRVSNLVLEANQTSGTAVTANSIRSERMVDFSSLFHRYGSKGKITLAKWNKLLNDVGARMRPTDATQVFNFIDISHNGFISMEEYTRFLSLTEHELDIAVEKMRVKLLSPCLPKDAAAPQAKSPSMAKTTLGVIGCLSLTANPNIGKLKIRESRALSSVFKMVNAKADNILSLDEVMDLAAKIELFVTEEEARKVLQMMDVNGDDRVDEADFILMMKRESMIITKKAHRIRETAAILRRWLVRGTSERVENNSSATASKEQWQGFQKRYQKSTGQPFPGFISAHTLQVTVASLGVCLSAIEARELSLVVAPEKNGRVHLSELHAFMGRSCRTFGELLSFLEREILTDLVEAYRACHKAKKSLGKDDVDLTLLYRRKLDEIKKMIESVYSLPQPNAAGDIEKETEQKRLVAEDEDEEDVLEVRPQVVAAAPDPRLKQSTHEVISIAQLRAGLQYYVHEKKIPEAIFPNLEEWTCLCILADADVAEGDIYGVRLRAFLEGIARYIVTVDDENRIKAGETVSLDLVARELKRQFYLEARAHSKNKRPDYKVIFDLFDENRNGILSLDELKKTLKRLQLVNSLADHQMPQLLALIDKNKNGQVTYEDLAAFAEEGRALVSRRGGGDEDHDYYDGDEDPSARAFEESEFDDGEWNDEQDGVSAVPPIAVTKDANCDWLAWFLYRQACHVDPLEPESILSELEARCAETEMVQNKSYITVKDLWNILFEVGLQVSLTKAQFSKGVAFVCTVGHGHDEDRVDYQALCRFAVRMGRAYRQQIQEKQKEVEQNFAPLLAGLKKFFKDLCAEHSARSQGKDIPRYEKIFRRIDADGDGMLSPREFRLALKRLQFKDVKLWTLPMVQRLFDECDRNKDGLLSIKEFTNYVLDRELEAPPAKGARGGAGSGLERGKESLGNRSSGVRSSVDRINLSDDEDDEVFSQRRRLTDHELLRKVNDVLIDIVPIDSSNMVRHWEVVRAAVRRFFQRADTALKGVVSEERFRAFLRRSGLQDALTASELRRLTDKLKRRGPVGAEAIIDYEKLCQMLTLVTESVPRSKADIAFARLQDAAVASAQAGRSFLNLCSLVDLRLTGRVTKDDLLHIAKMMDCHLTTYDLEAILELLPPGSITSERTIDYRVLNTLLQTYTVRDPHLREIEPMSEMGLASTQHAWGDATGRLRLSTTKLGLGGGALSLSASTGALPAYATPGANLYAPLAAEPVLNRSISTPLGYSVTTPYRQGDAVLGQSLGTPYEGKGQLTASAAGLPPGAYDRIVRQLLDRIHRALEQRGRQRGPYSLRRRFESMDPANTGLIQTRGLQIALDEIGVTLTPSELHTLYGLYGRPQDDNFYYDSFCRLLDSAASSAAASQSVESFLAVPYLHERCLTRYRELRGEGRSPRDMFEAYDLDRTGLVTATKFKEIIVKLDLLQTEHQLARAMEDCSSIGNRAMINYEDFCDRLERAAVTAPLAASRDGAAWEGSNRSAHHLGIADGDGYDGLRGSAMSPHRLRDSYGHGPLTGRDSLQRFRASHSVSRNANLQFPIDLEDGSDSHSAPASFRETFQRDGPLSPPRLSDSLTVSQRLGSPSRLGGRSSWEGLGSTSSSIQAPRTSPSKVGSRMWGNSTPLSRKGETLKVGGNKWCCPVCLYVENPSSADLCVVCDSPNYSLSKDYSVKEQCRNCTFLNGQFAEVCEMCGERLSHARDSKPKESNNMFEASSIPGAAGRYSRKDTYY